MSEKTIDMEISYLIPTGDGTGVKKELLVSGTWATAIKTAKSLDAEGYIILGIIYRPEGKIVPAVIADTPTEEPEYRVPIHYNLCDPKASLPATRGCSDDNWPGV